MPLQWCLLHCKYTRGGIPRKLRGQRERALGSALCIFPAQPLTWANGRMYITLLSCLHKYLTLSGTGSSITGKEKPKYRLHPQALRQLCSLLNNSRALVVCCSCSGASNQHLRKSLKEVYLALQNVWWSNTIQFGADAVVIRAQFTSLGNSVILTK